MMIYGDIGTSPLYLGPLLIMPLSNLVNTVPIYGATSCVCWTLTLECTFMCLLTFHTENTEKVCTHASDICNFLFQGQGPLWTASFYGHLNVVKMLLAGGANVNQGDEVGYT